VELHEADCRRYFHAEVWFYGEGDMYLSRGWKRFTEVYSLSQGNIMAFRYYNIEVFVVEIYDGTLCRTPYMDEHDSCHSRR
jgi:hypothetical protein